ncbi:MAG: hydrogenase maturation nickel metallochaperone HypA [Candidatus Manganitrophus sp.]|nr:hydrogenase maturation nickel metallochaperone HypA [Candidatus Manganitrophus sp.]MDC4226687.1 hydrogenase maturation nickel metallochaperone HypA [Candidatus Manganitrophus sp.]WDT72155.1 MAG: hydrogenase maturation nickel metallochaperone HypA [Candidatus Manganitrophus sp.]
MHEASLISGLIRQIESIAHPPPVRKVVGVTLRIGPLCATDPDHLRDHFLLAAQGTIAEGAELNVETIDDPADPNAASVVLRSIEVEE